MTHTPGPWAVYKNRVYAGTNHLRGQDVAHVRTNLFDDEQEQERMIAANARLIAASPDMLAALQEALKTLEYAAMVLEPPERSAFRQSIDDVRLAIMKAKGE